MVSKGSLSLPVDGCIIGLDAEWTKNYKIKNGNIPFCYSIVSVNGNEISYGGLLDGNVRFDFVQFYCQNPSETRELIVNANTSARNILESLQTSVLCGHQLSSDLSVLINYARFIGVSELSSLETIQERWHGRKRDEFPHVFDTRYDIQQSFLGKSRRLVDMSNDFLLDVSQPELGNSSMTKLHMDYVSGGSESIRERISVMNIRHSLCAAILYWLNVQVSKGCQLQHANINRILGRNLAGEFNWILSKTFQDLL